MAHLGAERSVLVLDETGDLKKGTATVATQRQYTGTAGRIENPQVAVYAVWATPRGHGFVDRELYVPESWTRCAAAGLPADLVFATKPELALDIVRRIVGTGAHPGHIAVEESFQAGKGLTGLDEHQVRRYTSWARWTVLAMLAHAFLAILAEQPDQPVDTEMIPLTCQEIAHLLATMLFNRDHPNEHRWAWSTWRRRRQHHARIHHYQRQHARAL